MYVTQCYKWFPKKRKNGDLGYKFVKKRTFTLGDRRAQHGRDVMLRKFQALSKRTKKMALKTGPSLQSHRFHLKSMHKFFVQFIILGKHLSMRTNIIWGTLNSMPIPLVTNFVNSIFWSYYYKWVASACKCN